jgi:hypothetical protein
VRLPSVGLSVVAPELGRSVLEENVAKPHAEVHGLRRGLRGRRGRRRPIDLNLWPRLPPMGCTAIFPQVGPRQKERSALRRVEARGAARWGVRGVRPIGAHGELPIFVLLGVGPDSTCPLDAVDSLFPPHVRHVGSEMMEGKSLRNVVQSIEGNPRRYLPGGVGAKGLNGGLLVQGCSHLLTRVDEAHSPCPSRSLFEAGKAFHTGNPLQRAAVHTDGRA